MNLMEFNEKARKEQYFRIYNQLVNNELIQYGLKI